MCVRTVFYTPKVRAQSKILHAIIYVGFVYLSCEKTKNIDIFVKIIDTDKKIII